MSDFMQESEDAMVVLDPDFMGAGYDVPLTFRNRRKNMSVGSPSEEDFLVDIINKSVHSGAIMRGTTTKHKTYDPRWSDDILARTKRERRLAGPRHGDMGRNAFYRWLPPYYPSAAWGDAEYAINRRVVARGLDRIDHKTAASLNIPFEEQAWIRRSHELRIVDRLSAIDCAHVIMIGLWGVVPNE